MVFLKYGYQTTQSYYEEGKELERVSRIRTAPIHIFTATQTVLRIRTNIPFFIQLKLKSNMQPNLLHDRRSGGENHEGRTTGLLIVLPIELECLQILILEYYQVMPRGPDGKWICQHDDYNHGYIGLITYDRSARIDRQLLMIHGIMKDP